MWILDALGSSLKEVNLWKQNSLKSQNWKCAFPQTKYNLIVCI